MKKKRKYLRDPKKNIHENHNVFYIENDRLFIYTIFKKWEDFYDATLTEKEKERRMFGEELLDLNEFEEITEEEAFIEIL